MDCSNYSYINYSDNNTILARDPDRLIYFEKCINWFNDCFYYVHSILTNDCGEFPLADFAAAVAFYNSLVGPEYKYNII